MNLNFEEERELERRVIGYSIGQEERRSSPETRKKEDTPMRRQEMAKNQSEKGDPRENIGDPAQSESMIPSSLEEEVPEETLKTRFICHPRTGEITKQVWHPLISRRTSPIHQDLGDRYPRLLGHPVLSPRETHGDPLRVEKKYRGDKKNSKK
jgi:hypothetical protein